MARFEDHTIGDLLIDRTLTVVGASSFTGAVDAGALRVNGVTSSVAVAGGTLAIPVTASYVAKTTGGAEALTLADGVEGQVITIALVVDGGTGTLTPATVSGFATVVLADAGDNVTLKFVDTTVGWVVLGAAGTAAAPVITV